MTAKSSLPPQLTLSLWEVGDGEDPEGRCTFVIAGSPEDVAHDRWGADAQVGRTRGGVRTVVDAAGATLGFVRTCRAPIVLPEGYPATVSFSTIDFAKVAAAIAAVAA